MTNANDLTGFLGGRWYGSYGTAPCPVCQPQKRNEQNALTMTDSCDGRLLLHCKRAGCAFEDILAAAGIAPGGYTAPDPALLAERERARRAKAEKRARQAARCWQEARSIQGTQADQYLRGRGISCELSGTLRFHPECWHGPTGRRLPAMVALVQGGDAFAVHRTYLAADSRSKAAVEPAKAMLGSTRGGAARLTEAQGPLVVAEG